MKKRIFTILVFLILSLLSCNEKTSFDNVLNNFRFGLYNELYNMNEQELIKYNFNSKILEKCDNFFKSNTNLIFKYKNEILQEYENNNFSIDLSHYLKLDDNIQKINEEIISSLNIFKNNAGSILQLLYINPIKKIDMHIIHYMSKEIKNFGAYTMRKSIGGSDIRTKKIKDNKWMIKVGEYDYIFLLEYNIINDEMSFQEIYKRIDN